MQAIEKFAENVDRIKSLLSQLCSDLHDTEFPNDVVQTESLRADHRLIRQEFSEDLESTVRHGEALRDCLADVSDDADCNTSVRHRTELRQDRLEHVDAIDRSVASFFLAHHTGWLKKVSDHTIIAKY